MCHTLLGNLTWTKARYSVDLCCLSLVAEGRTHTIIYPRVPYRVICIYERISRTQVEKRDMINFIDFPMFILD